MRSIALALILQLVFGQVAQAATATAVKVVEKSLNTVQIITPGPQGPPGSGSGGGSGVTWKNSWSIGTSYSVDDAVERNGSSYRAVQTSTGIDPAADSGKVYWYPIALKGNTGATGAPGASGSPGTAGPNTISATTGVAVGNAGDVLINNNGTAGAAKLGTAAFSNRTSFPGTAVASTTPVDTDGVPLNRGGGWLSSTWTTIKSAIRSAYDSWFGSPLSTYVLAPFGASYKADYYCSAIDCGNALQSAFDAIKASGKGGVITAREGIYPFATGFNATDADTVKIKGVGGTGMWANGGTIFRRTTNITLANYSAATKNPRACQIEGIHFQDASTGYLKPLLKYKNAHNMTQKGNYFNVIPQAIYADRPWDFWTLENNFRSCGTGDTKDTACVTMYNGATDKVAGWMVLHNRFEPRPGTSIYSDATGASGRGNDTVNISFNKFEGVDGQAYPAIHGQFWGPRIIGNSVYYGDAGKPTIWIENQPPAWSGLAVIEGNRVSNHKSYAIQVSGDKGSITGNTFDTQQAPAAHIRIESGAGNVVGVNPASDSIPMLSDNGTGTRRVTTSLGAQTAGKQLVYDAAGNIVPSAYDAGSTTSSGLADPGSNGIMKRTDVNTTSPAVYGDVVALFGSGACTGFLKNDGTCGTAGVGSVTSVSSPNADINVANGTSTPVLTLNSGAAPLQIPKLDSLGGLPLSGFLKLNPVVKPTAPSGVAIAGGSLGTGNYLYAVTYYNSDGETELSPVSATVTTTTGNNQVTLTIPVSSDLRVTGRRIYRTTAGGTAFKRVTSLANNIDVTYNDTLADGSLAAADSTLRENTTLGLWYDGSTRCGVITVASTGFGRQSLQSLSAGTFNTAFGSATLRAVTTGSENAAFGYQALQKLTTGSYNLAIGTFSLYNLVTGSSNTAFGKSALTNATNGGNTAVGTNSGGNITTGDNNTFIGTEAGNAGTTNSVSKSIGIGYNAQVTASNTAVIGGSGVDAVTIRNGDGTFSVTPAGALTAKTVAATIPAASIYGTTSTVDLGAGAVPSLTMTGNTMLAFSNPIVGSYYTFLLKQDATGSRVPTWPTTGMVITWIKSDGTATTTGPTMPTAANAVLTTVILPTSSTTAYGWAAGY